MEYAKRERTVQVKAHSRRPPRRQPSKQPHRRPRGRSPMKGLKLGLIKATLAVIGVVAPPYALLTQQGDPRITIVGLGFYGLSLGVAWCWLWVRKWDA